MDCEQSLPENWRERNTSQLTLLGQYYLSIKAKGSLKKKTKVQ
jgi:hypothetical protein